jgi:hypothetical protein
LKADIPLSSKLFAIRCASFFFPLEFKWSPWAVKSCLSNSSNKASPSLIQCWQRFTLFPPSCRKKCYNIVAISRELNFMYADHFCIQEVCL